MTDHIFRPISRDQFARHDIVRATVPKSERKSCEWCGYRPGRFRYGIAPDAGRPWLDAEAFCCKSCADSYRM